MVMLFFAFLGIEFYKGVLRRDHLWVLLLNITLPILFYLVLRPLDPIVALSAFVVGIAPTAAGAPVFADFLKTKVESVTASVLVTSPIVAIGLPFLLAHLVGLESSVNVLDILIPVCIVIFVPLVVSLIVRHFMRRQLPLLLRWKKVSFYLFLTNLYIAASKASNFIQNNQDTAIETIAMIAGAISLLAVTKFTIGKRLGASNWALANSLSLGRKNTMFAIWVSLTFLSPAVALGPMFYILAQNTYNGWQLYQVEKKPHQHAEEA